MLYIYIYISTVLYSTVHTVRFDFHYIDNANIYVYIVCKVRQYVLIPPGWYKSKM